MVYYPVKDVDVPDIDLVTLIFDSPITWLKEDTIAHAEAALPENCVTKAENRTITKRLIHVLRTQFGIGANGAGKDVVVVMSSGQILLSSIFYATIGAGGVYSAASPAYTASELARQIKQGPTSLVIVSEDCKDVGIKAATQNGIPMDRILVLQSMGGKRELQDVTGNGQNFLIKTAEMDWERITDPKILTERAICLLYSSGTTGPPKGVHISHRNMVYEGVMPQLVYREYFESQKVNDPTWKYECRTLAHLPVAHIAGCQGYLVNPTIAGGPVYWMPKFDWPKFLEYMKKFAVTYIFTAPPVWLLIAKSPLVTDQFESLQLAITGAAPMGAELKELAESKIGCHRIGQTWGLSETTGSCTLMPWDQKDSTGSVSPLMPNCRMRIVDDDENDVVEGEEGEFIMQGPVVTQGYWNNEQATKESFTKDGKGWFKTGDIGVCKNGKFYIVDRKKEMIKYKALQVAPAEVEALLLSHTSILDAAVIGVSDPEAPGNELPRAYVVVPSKKDRSTVVTEQTRDDALISADEIKAFVKNNLANHKQLRGGVVFLDVIPKSAAGKILRRVLRDQAKMENQTRPKL